MQEEQKFRHVKRNSALSELAKAVAHLSHTKCGGTGGTRMGPGSGNLMLAIIVFSTKV